MVIVNLTPHPLVLVDNGGNVIVELPSEGVARARQTNQVIGEVEIEGHSIPIVKTIFGEVEDLPEPDERTAYVVSIITVNAARAQGRSTDDLLTTSGLVRDDDGRIIGCTQFARM